MLLHFLSSPRWISNFLAHQRNSLCRFWSKKRSIFSSVRSGISKLIEASFFCATFGLETSIRVYFSSFWTLKQRICKATKNLQLQNSVIGEISKKLVRSCGPLKILNFYISVKIQFSVHFERWNLPSHTQNSPKQFESWISKTQHHKINCICENQGPF